MLESTFKVTTKSPPVVCAVKCFPNPYLVPTMIVAVTPAVQSNPRTANHSSYPTPRRTCLMLWVYRRAKNLNARIKAAKQSNMMDTASKVGPLLASDVES